MVGCSGGELLVRRFRCVPVSVCRVQVYWYAFVWRALLFVFIRTFFSFLLVSTTVAIVVAVIVVLAAAVRATNVC